MKTLKIIALTFILAFATSTLYELDFISKNPVRYFLVILLILVEISSGFVYFISELKAVNKKSTNQ